MKKILLCSFMFIIVYCCIFINTSCGHEFSYEDLNNITYEQILSQKEAHYVVVCWEYDCVSCENFKEAVGTYFEYTKDHKDAVPLYGMNVTLKYNKGIVLTEGDYEYMYDVTDYTKIKLRATPALFIIKAGKVADIISDYSTRLPVTNGKKYLESLMK